MLKIPYGQSDFRGLRENGYFYQDRTNFIEKLEHWSSNFPVFLRPRRFGKSLFVSLLHHYYGIEHKDDFQALFGGLYIGQNPTENANRYLVLRFEFSRIETTSYEKTYHGFLENVRYGADIFLSAYPAFFKETDRNSVLTEKAPESVLKAIFRLAKTNNVPHKIYVIIDEYDHFANELLSFDLDRFKENVSRNGFVRKFYESLKTASGEGIVDRIFITGVSPITLDSLTSGFNISDNISLNPIFNEMMGFTHLEVEDLLKTAKISNNKIPGIMADLRAWYDGYLFSEDADTLLFNPDMVLYFLKEYQIKEKYPAVMLDTNVVSDYSKVRNIFKIGDGEDAKFELLNQLVNEGYIEFPLTRLYNLELNFTQDDFLSLLFYMGMLTYREYSPIGWRCEIPNYVMKKLYFEYFTSIYLAKTRLGDPRRAVGEAVLSLIREGNPEPFFKLVEYVLTENHSNRDELSFREKHLQTLMIGLLFPYETYYIHSEYEARRGYPDIFLERIPHRAMTFDIVFELKYVKKSQADTLPSVIQAAAQQLDSYMRSERFARPDVRGFYVVFLGGEVHQWQEWGKH
jgi:hypothetical protein